MHVRRIQLVWPLLTEVLQYLTILAALLKLAPVCQLLACTGTPKEVAVPRCDLMSAEQREKFSSLSFLSPLLFIQLRRLLLSVLQGSCAACCLSGPHLIRLLSAHSTSLPLCISLAALPLSILIGASQSGLMSSSPPLGH